MIPPEAFARGVCRPVPAALRRALVALLAGPLCALPVPAAAGPAGQENPADWPQYHRSNDAWRYSPLDQIHAGNVARLKVAWIHQPGDLTHGLQATPIVIDGVLYYVSAYNNVWAVDGATGRTLWRYAPTLDPLSNDVFYVAASRGVTVGRGKVFLGTLDGRFIALDQKTGKELWSTRLTDQKTQYGALFSSPPQLAGKVLFGGTTGGDQPQRGKIYAVDADSGAPLWTFDTIKDDPASWPGDSGNRGGGGAWLPGTYDPDTDTLYIGTSNAAPDFNGEARRGDNKYTASLLALEPATGRLKWYRQEIPHDVWDHDSAYEALRIPHAGKELIVHLNKSGFVFVMDKRDGSLHNVWRLVDHINTVASIDPKTGELSGRNEPVTGQRKLLCPWLLGARSWNHGAYHPGTGLWYTNTMEACNEVAAGRDSPEALKSIGALSLGIADLKTVPPPSGKALGRLVAVEPLSGRVRWKVDYEIPALSSVLATAGGLVFNGDVEGNILAYAADSGRPLWRFSAGSGLRGGPVSYLAGGRQYLVFPTGLGSHAPGFMASAFPRIKQLPGGAALVAFTLE